MSYTALKDRPVKAVRKRRLCEWCAYCIEAGEPAQNRVYTFDNEFHNDYMHPECYAAMHEVDWHGFGQWEWMPGDFERGSSIPL
jgi:hypothetical protein